MSLSPNDLDARLDAFRNGGWDALEGADPDLRKRLDLDRERDEERKRIIASAWARFAGTPDGKIALQALLDATLGRTVFFTNLQLPPENTAVWGAFREGQNAVATEILRQINIGRGDSPKPQAREIPA